jgi:hypothetical protein
LRILLRQMQLDRSAMRSFCYGEPIVSPALPMPSRMSSRSGRGKESKAKIDGAGLFFSGNFGQIELGQGRIGPRTSRQGPDRRTVP